MNLQKLHTFLSSIKSPYYFGFFPGHEYLTAANLQTLEGLIASDKGDAAIVQQFERSFAQLIGPGQGLSFAAGRMAFYTLLKTLKISDGDEIILPAFTCSVMANAVLRTGAIPIYADIDPRTLGSGADSIRQRISPRTKMVVAQHSFGIPCAIDKIKELTEKNNVFLLEDCAIALDSSYKGISVGNWGNAAMFSTDHSKPINTLIGGFLYSRDMELLDKVRKVTKQMGKLDVEHQKRLFKKLLFERKYLDPEKYYQGLLINISYEIKNEILAALIKKNRYVFLEADYGKSSADNSYPYPAQMPQFLAQLGLWEINKWGEEKKKRIERLKKYIQEVKNAGLSKYIPSAYFDKDLNIIPLRFIMLVPNIPEWDKKMKKRIEISWTWFRQPVICSSAGPQSMGYMTGSCPNAEQVNKKIINWPCVVARDNEDSLLDVFRSIVNEAKAS